MYMYWDVLFVRVLFISLYLEVMMVVRQRCAHLLYIVMHLKKPLIVIGAFGCLLSNSRQRCLQRARR
jgi:uncharacterized integral membrane protein